MTINLYTIHCPACKVLEKKMEMKGLTFNVITDEKIFQEKQIAFFPMLEVNNGPLMNFSEAVRWVNAQEDK